ncbi:hypothetical protein G7Y89_g236 [Cudoniella acicularis]|uniref:Altered inheritance of mitochondria protein 21 n=1 Tax=Cudoniella acicularis TaxID=354080 RepID=A0A8H4RYJ1_9HELO|nr:hypothetical protein G7Y89_g236 [Cudoniella acicularis]
MSTAMPQIPPRPTRAQKDASSVSSSLGSELPKIPPRPAGRRPDRSISPQRESYARSPLNETPFLSNQAKSSLSNNNTANALSSDLPPRPPSVVLPSLGQEGTEYAEVFGAPEELGTSPTQTRNISNDLKLHAPKPSLPGSSAKQRVSTVTRTDSGQAAAFGIGNATTDDKDPASRPLKAKASFASQTSNSTERPPSSADSEHGIPEIGQRVPMYPNAGDVQAPSPAPFPQPYAPGVGFHNDGSKPRHHGRKLSARDNDMPLEAYGRHGHQVLPHDRFEKAYYEKRPELFKKELGQYGEGRPEWAMSSEDLNKIVRDTASRGAGLGTSPAVMGTPTEQVGFQASEEYASRMSSPRPQSSSFTIAHSNTSQTHVESPLRKESFQADVTGKNEFESTLSRSLDAPSDTALESEVEDDDVIHVDPARRVSRIYGGDAHLDSTEDLGPNTGHGGEEDGIHDELGYSAPILASDEVAKEPFGWELQPAVSPLNDRTGSESGFYYHKSTSQSSLNGSRPSSRPGSIHGNVPGLRLPSDSMKLEDLEEYEPLFPEEEKNAIKEKPLTTADRLKRPELKNRKFPSQDIWEDTPNSLQYTATVSTPQLPEETEATKEVSEETPEKAFARRQEELAEKEYSDSNSFLYQEKKPWEKKAHLVTETRPGMKQRFPSRDIWEDTPDSLQLQTTVAGPQSAEKEALNPPEDHSATGAVADQDKTAASLPLSSEEGRATTGVAGTTKPHIPARPTKSKLSESPEKSQPPIPERPARQRQAPGTDTTSPALPIKAKPQVPARPSKPLARESSENIPLSQVASNSSAKSVGSDQGAAAAAKPKPPVPSRPIGSKIAALQGGFMSDLNKRLQLGPQAPKKEEPAPEQAEVEKEKVPLADARKGRARGPARRAPAKSPSPGAVAAPAVEKPSTLTFSMPSTLWEIDPEEDQLHVVTEKEEIAAPPTKTSQSETPTLTTNTAEQSLHEPDEISADAEKLSSLPSVTEDLHPQKLEEAQTVTVATESSGNNHDHEPVKASDEPTIIPKDNPAPEALEEEDLSASIATLKPEDENVD